MTKRFSLGIALLVFVSFLAGCVSTGRSAPYRLSFTNTVGHKYKSKPGKAAVDVYFQSTPPQAYEVIGEISGRLRKNTDVRSALEAKTRRAGGDAVIDVQVTDEKGSPAVNALDDGKEDRIYDMPVSETYSYDVIMVKGKVIRYK